MEPKVLIVGTDINAYYMARCYHEIYHKKVERNIKPSDFAPHVDDLGVAITLMSKESPFSSFIHLCSWL